MQAILLVRRLGLVLALGCGLAAPAWADVPPPMDKAERKAAERAIDQQEKAELKACDAQQGRTREICRLQAKGRAQVAHAKLEAQAEPSHDADKNVKEATADAALAVAKARCEDAPSKPARTGCLAQAKHAYESAVRRAKVEKVQAMNADKAKAEREAKRVAARQ